MTPKQLSDIVLSVPEYVPQSLRLLRELRQDTGNLFPPIPSMIDRGRVMQDINRMRNAAGKLQDRVLKVPPIEVQHPDLVKDFLL